jgi:hypothetical protein
MFKSRRTIETESRPSFMYYLTAAQIENPASLVEKLNQAASENNMKKLTQTARDIVNMANKNARCEAHEKLITKIMHTIMTEVETGFPFMLTELAVWLKEECGIKGDYHPEYWGSDKFAAPLAATATALERLRESGKVSIIPYARVDGRECKAYMVNAAYPAY